MRRALICCSTRIIQWIGTRGGRKRSRRRAKKTSRFFFPSATRRAIGATSWSGNRSRTRRSAAILNKYFVPIKVDREERPDVDRIYMAYVQATTGGGGWPMSVWLTPDLKPFVGGTYFPPENRYGRAGFPALLERIGQAWRTDREKIVQSSGEVVSAARAGRGGRALGPAGCGRAARAAFFSSGARSIRNWEDSAPRQSSPGR